MHTSRVHGALVLVVLHVQASNIQLYFHACNAACMHVLYGTLMTAPLYYRTVCSSHSSAADQRSIYALF